MFKVAIIGGEKRGDYKFFAEKCVFFLKNKTKDGIRILTTGDTYVDIFSITANIDKQVYYCDWKANGKETLKVRNNKIINDADAFIIFEDGTKDTNFFIEMAKTSGKPLRVIKL
jgi:hypothetical protein